MANEYNPGQYPSQGDYPQASPNQMPTRQQAQWVQDPEISAQYQEQYQQQYQQQYPNQQVPQQGQPYQYPPQQYQQQGQYPNQYPYPQQQYPHQQQQYPQQQQPTSNDVSISGLAIAGLVLGILGLAGSPIPIINNVSFFLGLIGLVLSVVGLLGINKGKHRGKGIAIAGIVLGAISLVAVLLVQAACSSMINDMTSNSNATVSNSNAQVTTTNNSNDSGSPQNSTAQGSGNQIPSQDTMNLAVGQTITTKDGLSVTVNFVDPNLKNFDGSSVVGATVTYVNNGSSTVSFNSFDWSAEDPNGAQRNFTFYLDSENTLNSGKLSPGGSVSGNVYFDGPVAKIIYSDNVLSSEPTAMWVIQ